MKEPWKRIDPEEELFRKCLLEFHDIESCRSTAKIDAEYHIDLYLGNGLSVDVKAQKKVHFWDKVPSDKYTWVEFKNASGRWGWLYGKATHIAFALRDYYLMVDRRHLADYAQQVLKAKGLLNEDGSMIPSPKPKYYKPYVIYTRNNLDRVMLVEIKDLLGLNHLIVKRDAGKRGKES